MQFTIPMQDPGSYHIADFIVSTSNREAYDFITGRLQKWGVMPYDKTLLLYGEHSAGKTHLAIIWQKLTNAEILSKNNTINLSSNSAFIIEDIENQPEEQLLHYFNLAHEHKKYLLLTTANLQNNFKLPDLNSRINSILRLEIRPPDDELLEIFLFKYFSGNSLIVSRQVQSFLLKHCPRRFDLLINLLKKINQEALTYKKAVTINLVKGVLGRQENIG